MRCAHKGFDWVFTTPVVWTGSPVRHFPITGQAVGNVNRPVDPAYHFYAVEQLKDPINQYQPDIL